MPNADWSKRHEEMIRIDDEMGEKAARAPVGRENPENVGVPRRRTKALRRSRRNNDAGGKNPNRDFVQQLVAQSP